MVPDGLLFLNTKKCKVLHFGNKTQLSDRFKYLEETIIEKDLGVYISYDLNWYPKFVLRLIFGLKWSQSVSHLNLRTS